MRNRFVSCAVLLGIVAAFSFSAAAQQAAPSKQASGPAPARDLSGIWVPPGISPIGFSDKHPKFTALGEKRFRLNKPGRGITEVPVALTNDPLDSCDPAGFPRNEIFEFRVLEVATAPDRMLFLYQYQRSWRTVFTDGRDFPKDLDWGFYGYSIGKWVDDYTFVVQTKGLDDRTWIDNSGLPHSTDMQVEERFHRVDHDTLEFTLTVTDPTIYTQSWTILDKMKLRLDNSLVIPEMICVPTEMEQYKKLIANPAAGESK